MRTNKHHSTFYFPVDLIEQIKCEAERQDRFVSWLMQQAWRIALPTLRKVPGPPNMVR